VSGVKVHEVHERRLPGDAAELIDHPERMWPSDRWPELRPEGLGFLRHELVEHEPGRRVTFRITGPRGLSGSHGWQLDGETMRHTVDGECSGLMRIGWPLVVKPIHSALHEDVLDRAEAAVGGAPAPREFSPRVRVLRRVLRRLA
jgi:hypothetical protein